jgi:hypothetical protein
LRRELALDDRTGRHYAEFHASKDCQTDQDYVFDLLAAHDFRIDATILDKTKTLPRLAEDPLRFYKQAWYLHYKYIGPKIAGPKDDLLVVASALQIKKKKVAGTPSRTWSGRLCEPAPTGRCSGLRSRTRASRSPTT